ncbi:MAG: methyltransferase domain-containing protein, partial [Candidatus Tagabacteria bacterium]
GVEVEFKQAEFARQLGLNVLSINAEDNLSVISQKFNLIWCTDFLVHMVSPYKFLYECRNLLEKNGQMVIQVPLMSIFNMHRSVLHFYAFNKKSLIYLLEMAGYEIVKTSGFLRKKPKWVNFIFDLLLQRWGGNIWVLAKKKKEMPVDFKKSFLPKWFKV